MNKNYLFLLFGFALLSFGFIGFTVIRLNGDHVSGYSYNQIKTKLVASVFNSKPAKLSPKRAIVDSLDYEQQFKLKGLVNIADMDSTICIDLKYSSPQNFTGAAIQGSPQKAYLQKDAAEKLVKAQRLLKTKFPFYQLKILDAARPVAVQKQLWEKLELPFSQKITYLSNPYGKGSLHNYGVAVDITIVNEENIEIDMGSAYDTFTPELSSQDNKTLLELGKLTYRQFDNRQLLRNIMRSVGFYPIASEWWHFNSCNYATAQAKYKLL